MLYAEESELSGINSVEEGSFSLHCIRRCAHRKAKRDRSYSSQNETGMRERSLKSTSTVQLSEEHVCACVINWFVYLQQ